jgi:hypothetical protein
MTSGKIRSWGSWRHVDGRGLRFKQGTSKRAARRRREGEYCQYHYQGEGLRITVPGIWTPCDGACSVLVGVTRS